MNSSTKNDQDIADFESSSNVFSPRLLDDILVFLPPNDKSYDNVSESSSVELVSHPFSEENSGNSKNKTKESFSLVHEQIIKEIRAEMEKAESVCSTCYSCSSCSTDTWEALDIDMNKVNSIKPEPFPEELKKELKAKINAYSIEIEKHAKKSAVEKEGIKLMKKNKRKVRKHDQMSGLWHMLSTYDNFVVTQPGYNVYQQEKPHWLDQQAIPWGEKEKARKKCVKWLEKYH